MIDDVIHDKYEKNSNEYYLYRIEKDENLLKNNKDNLILYDNLAVGYNQIGNSEKALNLYKIKRNLMETREFDKQNWYRYYANLWTFLIHDWIGRWFKNQNDQGGKDLVIEWRDYIKKAIEINIDAHFWRENYQLIANNWIIESFSNKEFMLRNNMLWKLTLDLRILESINNNRESCGRAYYDIYPEVKKQWKSIDKQITDSCPMALKWVVWMIRLGWGPNPYSFSTIGDILVSMGEYKLAFASYARSIQMKHPNTEKIIVYMERLAQKIYPELSQKIGYQKLLDQFNSDYKVWNDWSNNYLEYQKKIIIEWKDPTLENAYDDFYNIYKYPMDVVYNRF